MSSLTGNEVSQYVKVVCFSLMLFPLLACDGIYLVCACLTSILMRSTSYLSLSLVENTVHAKCHNDLEVLQS